MKTLNVLKATLEHMEYYNNLSPFPVYDTGNVQELKDYIKMVEKRRNEYDELPVVCCKHCMDLFIMEDEVGNDICGRCGAVNEIQIFDNIDIYLEERRKINENY